jgi:hypothetical protein
MEAAQSPAQLLAYLAEFQAVSALAGNYAVIRRSEEFLAEPVKLPDQPLEAISDYCVAYLAAHGYSYSYGRNGRFHPDQDEIGRVNFVPLPGNPQEVRSFQDPLLPGEAVHVHAPLFGSDGDRQPLAPLGAPSLDDEPAVLG